MKMLQISITDDGTHAIQLTDDTGAKRHCFAKFDEDSKRLHPILTQPRNIGEEDMDKLLEDASCFLGRI